MATKKHSSHKRQTRKRTKTRIKKHIGLINIVPEGALVERKLEKLVSVNPQVKEWVSSQSKPSVTITQFLKDKVNAIHFKSFISYKKLLDRVVKTANGFQSKGYKVVDIAGSSRQRIEFIQNSPPKEHYLNDLYNRITEFTIYYRKYKLEEPLAKKLQFEYKRFSNFYENKLMRKYIASFMTKHEVLCHVELPFTSVKPGNIKMTDTLVVFFYYSE